MTEVSILLSVTSGSSSISPVGN